MLDGTPNWLREHLSERNPRVRQYQRRRNEGDWVNMIEAGNDADDEDDGVDFEENGQGEAESDGGDSEYERMMDEARAFGTRRTTGANRFVPAYAKQWIYQRRGDGI